MSKINLTDLSTITGNETSAINTINNNSTLIETFSDNTLSRDGTSPNTMLADLDMNSHRVLNCVDAVNDQEPATYGQTVALINALQLSGSGAPVGASYVTLAATPLLSAERVLTAGTNISLIDGGAGSTLTVNAANSAPTTASYLTLGTDATLTSERVLTAGSGINFVDGGAGSTLTVSSPDQTVALTGDVTGTGTTSVATTIANNAVTTAKIINDAVTYAKIQNVSATSRLLGRKTAAAGDTEECTLTEALDFVGSPAQGDLLYRDSGSWTRLGAGTSGRFLKTQGAAANPIWADVPSFTAASQAEQEAGSSNVVSVTPLVQPFHTSAAKWWLKSVVSGGVPAQTVSYNVSSITDTATGRLTVSFVGAFSSSEWVCLTSVQTTSGTIRFSFVNAASSTTSSVELGCVSTVPALADPDAWFACGFGDR